MQILDETLDLNKSKQYKLSILIQKGGLSFIILDVKLSKVIAYKYSKIDVCDNIKEYCYFMNKLLNQEEFVKSKYSKVEIIYQTYKYTSIPENFYSEENKDDLFQLNIRKESYESILVNHINSIAAKKLFSIPDGVLEIVNEHFPKERILHQTTPIIHKNIKNNENLIVLNIQDGFFDIQVFDNKKLLLDNAFRFKTKEDFLYYLLFTLEQLNLEAKTQKIAYFTDIKKNFKLVNFSKKYFGGFEVAEQDDTYNFSYLFSKEDINKITPQIFSFGCE